MDDSHQNQEENEGQHHGLIDFNPYTVCLFLLLGWSILNGILGFFVGHIFNSAETGWIPLLIWIAFAILVPLSFVILMSRYFHGYRIIRTHGTPHRQKKSKEASRAISEEPQPSSSTSTSIEGQTDKEEETSASKKGWFSARCNNIASHYLLSKRETEVLFLLAKGHNAAFVQDQLCISRSTAKTHINHIYRKLNIHTQQELLNMIEDGPRRETGRVVGSFPGVMQMNDPHKVVEEAAKRASASPEPAPGQKNYRRDIFSN